jgi:hypothetical protein
MSWGRDADERNNRQPAHEPIYTKDELERFEAYCIRLHRLAQLKGVACETVATTHLCPACRRRVPAGIVTGYIGSRADLCPACVTAKKLVSLLQKEPLGALDQELLRLTPGDEETEKAAFFSALGKIGAR